MVDWIGWLVELFVGLCGWLVGLIVCFLAGHPLNASFVCLLGLRLIVRRFGFDGATDLFGSTVVRLVFRRLVLARRIVLC